jgi:signal transduction histidine kinase
VERSLLRGLAVFRWAAWIWMATVLALARGALVRTWVAVGLVGAALLVTVWATLRLRDPGRRPDAPLVVGSEVAVALGLQLADGFVYRAPHVFESEQPLGVAWPLAAILSTGVRFGPLRGVAVAVLLGGGRAWSSIVNLDPGVGTDGPTLSLLTPQQGLSLITTTVLYALAGGVGGYIVQQLRRAEVRVLEAEREVADVRAREDVARRLHDGVLQTLALVERRTDDPALARLARDQERDLRGYLFDTGDDRIVGRGPLGAQLRAAARHHETVHGGRVEVLVPDDLPDLDAATIAALVGAAGEALTNAAKHGAARVVIVSVEPGDHEVVVSVRDDGHGYDPATTPEGVGRSRSIRGRLADVGGSVEELSAPGRGAEVRLHVPDR